MNGVISIVVQAVWATEGFEYSYFFVRLTLNSKCFQD